MRLSESQPLSIASLPPRISSKPILSDFNYARFLAWLAEASPQDADDVLSVVYITYHRDWFGWPDDVPLRGRKLKVANCFDVGCARCRDGRGGYRFKWIHPFWTEDRYIGHCFEDPDDLRADCIKLGPGDLITVDYMQDPVNTLTPVAGEPRSNTKASPSQ